MPVPEPPDERLTFPPFPTAPPGVTLVPFKAFKERGIQMFATEDGDDVERDGLGIPTVELRVKHNTDSCKTETKRKRRHKAEQAAASRSKGPGAARREWWEQWADNEDTKMTGPYNPHTSALDRMYEAAADFRKTRTWPQGPSGVAAAWDQFRLFVGLLSNTPVWTRTDRPAQEGEDDDDDEAEFEDKENVVEASFEAPRGPKKFAPRPRARPPYALYGVEPVPVGSDDEVKVLLNNENVRREEQMIEFLNDPEFKIKIFLSSYMRKQGLIWTDRNLINIPHLIGFFVRFLLRNRVFPEPEFERAFKRALDVVGLAQKELILTSKIAKQLPDELNKALRACWGQKADGYKPLPALTTEEGDKTKEEEEKKRVPEELNDDSTAEDEPDAKRAKLDASEPEAKDTEIKAAVERFEEELKADNVEVIKLDKDILMDDAERLEGIRDNLDPSIDALPPWANDIPTSSDSGGWAEASGAGKWNIDDTTDADMWAAPVPVDWAPPAQHALFPWLGLTALPLTHGAGAVECSVRRIKAFSAPPAPGTLPKSAVSSDPDASAVEVELERRFAKVVLGPWAEWDAVADEMPHMAVPRVLETSRGPIRGVVDADGKVAPAPAGEAEAEGEAEGPKPHDPLNDEITVLVEPEVLPLLSIGLGIGGTWVQIAREEDFGGEKKKKKKKKSKTKKVEARYWYIDELTLILPSYHT